MSISSFAHILKGPFNCKKLNAIPKAPGVYSFYSQAGSLLYVGKSVSLRDRVLSHFREKAPSKRAQGLVAKITQIAWMETAGELGALLKEAWLIKTSFPILNRQLRRHRTLFAIALIENSTAYSHLQVVSYELLTPEIQVYGLFRRKQNALEALRKITKENNLCLKYVGFDKSKGPCFYRQLHRCRGACVYEEEVAIYNERLQNALVRNLYKPWPFKSKVALKEESKTKGYDYHIVDEWRYLGTLSFPSGTYFHVPKKFDLDIYRILLKSFTNKIFPLKIIEFG